MGSNPWLLHVKQFWAKNKSKGISYSQALKQAKATYTKKGAAKPAAKGKKGKKKKSSK
jgi:hypothetical protein